MEKTLSRFEAQLVAEWISEKKEKTNWTAVWRLTPSAVAKKFGIKKEDVCGAARRQESKDE